MLKVLIINFLSASNKGSAILVDLLIELLNRNLSDSHCLSYTLHSYYKDYNKLYVGESDSIFKASKELILKNPLNNLVMPFVLLFCCMLYATINKYLNISIEVLLKEQRLKEYYEANIVIPTGGDNLCEGKGIAKIALFFHLLNLSFAALLSKDIFICAESVGPFNNRINKFIANIILNRVKIIILRDKMSEKYLRDIKVDKPNIYVTSDLAFCLDPAPKDRIDQILFSEEIDVGNRPIVGISPNKLIFTHNHCVAMANAIDYIVDTLGVSIIFVPHVLISTHDDRNSAKEIYDLLKNTNKIKIIQNEYTPKELKGIIGQCELFIGARMHPTIASTSMLVPTIGIAYSHKMHGIIGELLGQEKYIIDIEQMTSDCLIASINQAWNNKEIIREDLRRKIPIVRNNAMYSFEIIKEWMDGHKLEYTQ